MLKRSVAVAIGVLLGVSILAPASAAPKKHPKHEKHDDGPTFDRDAAAAALAGVDLGKCHVTNAPRGEGHVTLTFATSGSVTTAVVDRGPAVGTPVGRCIAAKYKTVKVPAFHGAPVQVGKAFRFE